MVKLSSGLEELLRRSYGSLSRRHKSSFVGLDSGSLPYKETVSVLESLLVELKEKGTIPQDFKLYYSHPSDELFISSNEPSYGPILVSELVPSRGKISVAFMCYTGLVGVILLVTSSLGVLYVGGSSSSSYHTKSSSSSSVITSSKIKEDKKKSTTNANLVKSSSSSSSSIEQKVEESSKTPENKVESVEPVVEPVVQPASQSATQVSSPAVQEVPAPTVPAVVQIPVPSVPALGAFTAESSGSYNSVITITGIAPVEVVTDVTESSSDVPVVETPSGE